MDPWNKFESQHHHLPELLIVDKSLTFSSLFSHLFLMVLLWGPSILMYMRSKDNGSSSSSYKLVGVVILYKLSLYPP